MALAALATPDILPSIKEKYRRQIASIKPPPVIHHLLPTDIHYSCLDYTAPCALDKNNIWRMLWELLTCVGINPATLDITSNLWKALMLAAGCKEVWVPRRTQVTLYKGDTRYTTFGATPDTEWEVALYLWRLVSGIYWTFWVAVVETAHHNSKQLPLPTIAMYFEHHFKLPYPDMVKLLSYQARRVTVDYYLTELCKPNTPSVVEVAKRLRGLYVDMPALTGALQNLAHRRLTATGWTTGTREDNITWWDNYITKAVMEVHGASNFGIFPTIVGESYTPHAEYAFELENPSYVESTVPLMQ